MMKSIKALAIAFLVATAGAGHSATIAVWNDTQLDPYAVAHRGNLTCNVACEVLNYVPSTYSFSAALGELFAGPANSGDASEAAWANLVLGTAFTTANVTAGKVEGVSDNTNYVTTAAYVIIKIGKNPDYSIIKNMSGGSLTWSWENLSGDGGGLSHYIGLGDGRVSNIPLPAGGLLLLGGLGGLAALRRRRST